MIDKLLRCPITGSWPVRLAVMCVAISLLIASCAPTSHVVRSPDLARFEEICASPALRDSLRDGKLVAGLPYFVASQLFADWDVTRAILVPCVGSRQKVEDFEGWDRRFSCTDIKIYLDEYEIADGNLAIWYQYPDFYRMGVSAGDTLFVFSKDRVRSSTIRSLQNSETLCLEKKLTGLADVDTLYGEIHYVENPKRPSGVSYWYLLDVLSDDRTVTLVPPNFEFYPIEQLEYNGERVISFDWRRPQ